MSIQELDLHYNFIAYPKYWVYPYSLNNAKELSLPNHGEKNPKNFKNSGYIEYKINTKSKLTTDFRENSEGDIYISGSEIRGRIRSNLEILSFSYPEFVEDKRILYRGLASKNEKVKKEYNKALGIKKNSNKKVNEVVNVGYLKKIDNKYYICPAEKVANKNFLAIDEYKLINNKNFNLETNRRMYKVYNADFVRMFKQLKNKEENLSLKIKELRKKTKLDKDKKFNEGLSKVYCKEKNDGCKWMEPRDDIRENLRRLRNALNEKVFLNIHTLDEEELKKCYIDRTETKLKLKNLWSKLRINDKFEPYEKNITYSTNENGGIKEIANADGNHKKELLQKGVLYCSTNAIRKKRHYLIGKEEANDLSNLLKIEHELINVYNDNLNKFRVITKKDDSEESEKYKKRIKDFYNIFSDESCDNSKWSKVVFYLTDEKGQEVINIGRTPYMKVTYKNTIKDIIDKNNPKDESNMSCISYANAIFGYTGKGENGREAYKARVRFTKAIIKKGKLSEKIEEFFLPQPHTSAFGMYLKQDGVHNDKEIISYADDINKIELRGYKFYKIRDKEKILKPNEEIKDMISLKRVLEPESEITGKIYFNNLSDSELGLLLISINISLLDGGQVDCYELFGGAKAYGYGKCKINIDNVYLEKGYKVLDFKDLGYEACRGYSEFVKSYKTEMKGPLKENKITVDEYKSSKQLKYTTDEDHYLDCVGEEEKNKFPYKENYVLKSLIHEMSSADIARTLSRRFKVR